MRVTRWIAGLGLIATVLLAGCSGGTTIQDIQGRWGVGTLTFVYSNQNSWTLRDTIIEVNTTTGEIIISGYDTQGFLWAYRGDYTRTGNRVTVEDMPEMELGNRDTMDLRLEFGRRAVSGAATNWVYNDSGNLAGVGTVPISGTLLSRTLSAQVTSAGSAAERAPKIPQP